MRLATLWSAIAAAGLACFSPQQAVAQRALAVVVSETVESWTVVCMRDLVSDEVSCSMISPVEAFAGQSWQALDPAVLSVTSDARDGQPRPVIGLVAPDFGFAAAFRLDARRAFRIEGNCVEGDCRVANAYAVPLAEELGRSATAVVRGATGPDLRVHVSGYARAWTRLLAIAAERVRPGDEAALLVAPAPDVPPLPTAPLTNVRLRRGARCEP
jgi:hypothetical protein